MRNVDGRGPRRGCAAPAAVLALTIACAAVRPIPARAAAAPGQRAPFAQALAAFQKSAAEDGASSQIQLVDGEPQSACPGGQDIHLGDPLPGNEALRLRVIRLAQQMDVPPQPPQAALEAAARGNYLIQAAGGAPSPQAARADFAQAAAAFEAAIGLAPWVPEYYLDLGVAAHGEGVWQYLRPFGVAVTALRWYLLAEPNGGQANAAMAAIGQVEADALASYCYRLDERQAWIPLVWAAADGDIGEMRTLLAGGADVNQTDSDGQTPLWLATSIPDSPAVAFLLGRGANWDQASNDGVTPLFLAAQNGYPVVAGELVAAGADVNQADQAGDTPLVVAAQNGQAGIVRLLLAHGAKPNAADAGGHFALILAVNNGHAAVARMLLTGGADVNETDAQGRTPLLWALKTGTFEALAPLLIAHGADVNRADAQGETPLEAAAANGALDEIGYLVAHGADINAAFWLAMKRQDGPAGLLLLDHGAEVNYANPAEQGETALEYAAGKGRANVVKTLLARGANPNLADRLGWTPLMVAGSIGSGDSVHLLLAHGADPDHADGAGRTALLAAAIRQHWRVAGTLQAATRHAHYANPIGASALRGATAAYAPGAWPVAVFLLARGADPNATGSDGLTATLYAVNAVHSRHMPLNDLQYLLAHGADPNQHGGGGFKTMTPLWLATGYGELPAAEALVAAGARVDVAGAHGMTPLMVAAQYGHLNLLQFLLAHGAGADHATPQGDTALTIAAAYSQWAAAEFLMAHDPEARCSSPSGSEGVEAAAHARQWPVMEFLAAHGADVNFANQAGETALLWASPARGNPAEVEFLVAHGADVNHTDKNGNAALDFAASSGHFRLVEFLVQHGARVSTETLTHAGSKKIYGYLWDHGGG